MIKIEQKKSVLRIEFFESLSKKDLQKIWYYAMAHVDQITYTTIEVNLKSTLFELSDLDKELIKRSCLYRNKNLLILIYIGKLDLSSRIRCLRYLNEFKIKNYKISYHKKH